MEEQKKEIPLMLEEEFKRFLNSNMYNSDGSLKLCLQNPIAVGRFKSVRRAIKRGHVTMFGVIYPRRPFNNRGTKDSLIKQKIYGVLKSRQLQV